MKIGKWAESGRVLKRCIACKTKTLGRRFGKAVCLRCRRKSMDPPGWVKNPKTLADVLQSFAAIGLGNVAYRGKGKVNPAKVKL
jgi:hypothetical protein